MPEPRVPTAQVRRFLATAFERLGMPAGDAQVVAQLMTEAELQGSDGHGVIRLVPYARRIRAGGINLKADPEVREKLNAQGLTPRGSTPEELGTATRGQLAKYGALIKANNITAE